VESDDDRLTCGKLNDIPSIPPHKYLFTAPPYLGYLSEVLKVLIYGLFSKQGLPKQFNMPNLPKEYKAAVFEAKGEPLTFKQVPLELPKPGEVCTVGMLVPSAPS
jgi:hypothetical protein